MGFWKTYTGFSPRARWSMAVSLVVGLCLVGLGFWGELCPPWFWPSWWHKLGYGLNVLASGTGFLIGVPITLVVLETIKSNAILKQQIESVSRISNAAWSDFSDAIHDFCTVERIKAVDTQAFDTEAHDYLSAASRVQAEHDLIFEKLEKCRDSIRSDNSTAGAQIADLKAFLATHATILEEKRRAVDEHFGMEFTIRPQWNYILSLWEVLNTHVRLRRIELQLDPMNRDSYNIFLDYLTSDQNPIFEFLKLHEGIWSKKDGITSMWALQSFMDLFIEVPDSRSAVIMNQDQDYDKYIGIGVRTYSDYAWAAAGVLALLKSTVDRITYSGWPGNATKPKPEDR